MKHLLIFLIFYLLQVDTIFGRSQLEGRQKEIMQECTQELNVNEEKYLYTINSEEYKKNPDAESSCMFACATRKLFSEDLFGKDRQVTLHKGLLKLIDEVYDAGFGRKNPNVSQDDVVNKIEECNVNEKTECKFFECVEFFKPPITDMILYYYRP